MNTVTVMNVRLGCYVLHESATCPICFETCQTLVNDAYGPQCLSCWNMTTEELKIEIEELQEALGSYWYNTIGMKANELLKVI